MRTFIRYGLTAVLAPVIVVGFFGGLLIGALAAGWVLACALIRWSEA